MYPSIEEVEKADRFQICSWQRFLPSPGAKYVGTPQFAEKVEAEGLIMDRIVERFGELGGFTPEISKALS